ncbi:MAG: DUF924 family protein [Panacagrimonas sp.]
MLTLHEDIEPLLEFWFGAGTEDPVATAGAQESLWWGAQPETDRLIGARFGDLRRLATEGALDAWLASARGRLAAIVLIDQFSRNLFRGRPEAFAHDALARSWCLDGIAEAADRALRPIERVFFYLPLEHSESREDQAHSVTLYEALAREVSPDLRGLFDGYAGFARAHRDIIERFDRFPHRNTVLGRPSTAEEQVFLTQPRSSF